MKNWQPVDYIVAGLGFILVFFFIATASKVLLTGIGLDDVQSKMIAGILSSIISIISLYVGSKLNTTRRNGNDNSK